MFENKPSLLLVKPNCLLLLDGVSGEQTAENFKKSVYTKMEVSEPALVDAALAKVFSGKTYRNLHIIIGNEVSFHIATDNKLSFNIEEATRQFRESIPLSAENLAVLVLTTREGVLFYATNAKIYKHILEKVQSFGSRVVAVIPELALEYPGTRVLNPEEMLGRIVKYPEFVKRVDIQKSV